jgi:cytochrome c oxidase cbb3-type subunit II
MSTPEDPKQKGSLQQLLGSIGLALGVFLTIAFSLTGLIVIPNWQFQDLKPVIKADGTQYPTPLTGEAAQGRRVYIDQGCIYCHTQQIRMKGYGADIRRNWGTRRSVPRDYIFEKPHQLGTMRTGPDLASIGSRQPSRDWHSLHLYNPQITSPGSSMPRFNYFFNEIKEGQPAPPGAIVIPAPLRKDGITHIVPNARGNHLILYLISLNKTFPLPEANQ